MNKDIVVLIPVYNPNEKIMDKFLDKLTKEFINIVFVNDGCSKKHDKYMNKLASRYPVLKHNVNLGKGRGLKNGINYILNNYPKSKVIVTADCDGQHSVKDIKKCGEVAIKNPDSLILGVRDFTKSDVPQRSKMGNVITRNVLYTLVGESVTDTQTGLRAASFDIAKKFIDTYGERYEYETNVLIDVKKKNIPIKEVVIDTIYINENETSHFNPVKDSIRVYKVFSKYILINIISYIIEIIFFINTFNISNNFYIISLYLLISKVLSSIIKRIFNNYVDIKYILVNYIISIFILSFINKYIVFVKILIDFILFIINLLNSQQKKVDTYN